MAGPIRIEQGQHRAGGMAEPIGQEVGAWAGLTHGVIGLHGLLRNGLPFDQRQPLGQALQAGVVPSCANPLPTAGWRGGFKPPPGIVGNPIRGGLDADAGQITQVIEGLGPELAAIALAPLLRLHQEQADESIGGVVTHTGDTADRATAEAAHPESLAIGMAIDGHVSDAGSEPFGPSPANHRRQVGFLQRADAQQGRAAHPPTEP